MNCKKKDGEVGRKAGFGTKVRVLALNSVVHGPRIWSVGWVLYVQNLTNQDQQPGPLPVLKYESIYKRVNSFSLTTGCNT